MGLVTIPYYRIRRNEMAYWEPTPRMKALGFSNVPLGKDGPEAWSKAHYWNAQYQKARKLAKAQGIEAVVKTACPYGNGTLGALYWHFTRSEAFSRKSRAGKDDYHRAWRYLKPAFADTFITQISEGDCERFQIRMEQNHSGYERYRTMQVFRKLMKECVKRQWVKYNPATSLPNPMPRGRSAFWLAEEIAAHITDAHQAGYTGLSVGLRIMWDTLVSPVDVRTLRLGQLDGDLMFNAREKTRATAIFTLSPGTIAAIEAYKRSLDFEIMPDAHLIRMRSGRIYKSKDSFSKDFRAVRDISFKGDTRRMADYRRSGNWEAALGGASKADRAAMLANTLDKDAFLDATYTPINRVDSDKMYKKRTKGRSLLLEQKRSGMLERITG